MKEETKLLRKIKEKGVTFSQIAKRLGAEIKPTTVFHWADGRKVPSARLKKALARIFACEVTDIF